MKSGESGTIYATGWKNIKTKACWEGPLLQCRLLKRPLVFFAYLLFLFRREIILHSNFLIVLQHSRCLTTAQASHIH